MSELAELGEVSKAFSLKGAKAARTVRRYEKGVSARKVGQAKYAKRPDTNSYWGPGGRADQLKANDYFGM